jgi:hypothetical protein
LFFGGTPKQWVLFLGTLFVAKVAIIYPSIHPLEHVEKVAIIPRYIYSKYGYKPETNYTSLYHPSIL